MGDVLAVVVAVIVMGAVFWVNRYVGNRSRKRYIEINSLYKKRRE